MKSTFASTLAGSAISRRLRGDQLLVEQLHEGVVDVLANPRQPLVDAGVGQSHDLAVEAVEELHVPRLVDLLGGQERLFGLVLVGHHEP